jgi:hypothetical protein
LLASAIMLAVLAPMLASADEGDCAQFGELTPPVVKDTDGREVNSTRAGQLVIIFSTFSNPCGFDQEIVVITEVRDQGNATAFFHSAQANASAFGSSEVGVLWYPENGGEYELRSFAISPAESQILTGVKTRQLSVVDYDLVYGSAPRPFSFVQR